MSISISFIEFGRPSSHIKLWKCKMPVPCVSVDPAKALKKTNIPPLLFDLIDLVSNPIYILISYIIK